jgi:hypothetical protein
MSDARPPCASGRRARSARRARSGTARTRRTRAGSPRSPTPALRRAIVVVSMAAWSRSSPAALADSAQPITGTPPACQASRAASSAKVLPVPAGARTTRAARADVSPREPIRSRISARRREKRSITRRGAGNRTRKGAPASGDLAPPRLITTADVPNGDVFDPRAATAGTTRASWAAERGGPNHLVRAMTAHPRRRHRKAECTHHSPIWFVRL